MSTDSEAEHVALVVNHSGDEAAPNDGSQPQIMDEEDEELAYSAAHVTSILKPVTVTMALVVGLVRMLGRNDQSQNAYSPLMVYQEEEKDDTTTKLGGAALNAVVFVGFIMSFTCLFVVLYKYRCMKIIYGWLALSVFMLLFGSGSFLSATILASFEVPIDYWTFLFVCFNFGVGGTLAIFYHAPMMVKQTYLVLASMIMAWVLTKLPPWTNWFLLAALALYDIMAVLAPCGPLKALVEMSQERDEPIPGLVYEASAPARSERNTPRREPDIVEPPPEDDGGRGNTTEVQMTDIGATSHGRVPTQQPVGGGELRSRVVDEEAMQIQPTIADMSEDTRGSSATTTSVPFASPGGLGHGIQVPEEDDDDEDRAVKLGLGDFVFYSVLVGRAADTDIATVFCCFVAILTGLCATLCLLAVYRKALPALPISIFLGMLFYFVSSYAIAAWVQEFSIHLIYV